MNKQDPKFIKDGMTTYANKVSSHHYATNQSEARIIFYPFFKGNKCIMIKAAINKDGKIFITTNTAHHRRSFREALFLDNKYYVKYRSIKRHIKYDNLFDGVKEYLDEQDESEFNSYTFNLKIKDEITKIVNK